jgi:hypothetical protein
MGHPIKEVPDMSRFVVRRRVQMLALAAALSGCAVVVQLFAR